MYKRVISLGWFCGTASEIKRIGLRDASYPFDWLITYDFSTIITMVDRGERFHFYNEEMFQYQNDASKWYNSRYVVSSFHDFSPFKKVKEQLDIVEEKYERRAGRFYNAICDKTIFIRYIKDVHEKKYILTHAKEIEQVLKRYNSENRIIYIANMELMQTFDHEMIREIYYVYPDKNDFVNREFLKSLPELEYYLLKNVEHPKTTVPTKKKEPFYKRIDKSFQYIRRQAKNENKKHCEGMYESVNEEIILFHRERECSGCGVCQAICPTKAISMEVRNEFYYPIINREKCIRCKQCLKICPFM